MPAPGRTFAAAVAMTFGLAAAVAHAAHPSLTEDTGTQGLRHVEVEIGVTVVRPAEGRIVELGPQVSVGVAPRVDAIVRPALSWIGGRENGARGVAATTTDVKWRFLDLDPVSVGLRAGVDWPTGSHRLGGERASFHGLLVMTRTIGDGTASLNVGTDRRGRVEGERRNIVQIAAGVAYPVAPAFTAVADVALQSNPDASRTTAPAVASIGAIARLAPWLDVDIGYRVALNDVARPQALFAGATFRW